jgi:hypothetical protein
VAVVIAQASSGGRVFICHGLQQSSVDVHPALPHLTRHRILLANMEPTDQRAQSESLDD